MMQVKVHWHEIILSPSTIVEPISFVTLNFGLFTRLDCTDRPICTEILFYSMPPPPSPRPHMLPMPYMLPLHALDKCKIKTLHCAKPAVKIWQYRHEHGDGTCNSDYLFTKPLTSRFLAIPWLCLVHRALNFLTSHLKGMSLSLSVNAPLPYHFRNRVELHDVVKVDYIV